MGKAELHVAIDAELLQAARLAGLDVDDLTTRAVMAALAQVSISAGDADQRARQWASENAGAIEAHRERIASFGVFGEDLRTW